MSMELASRRFKVELPIGMTDSGGQIHRTAHLRKMTGVEEALLYEPSLTAAQLVTELLASCLVDLGGLEMVDTNVVSALYSADRNYLLLELRRITLGDYLRAVYVCPRCHSEVMLEEDLGTLAVRRLGEDEAVKTIEVVLLDGWRDQHDELHTEVVLDLPRGVDEEFVAKTARRDPLAARDALLLRCIRRFGSVPRVQLEAFGLKILRELTLGDRRKLFTAIDEHSPGVHFRRRVRCGHCEAPFDTVLDAAGFFALG
jgi:hypothetical protein